MCVDGEAGSERGGERGGEVHRGQHEGPGRRQVPLSALGQEVQGTRLRAQTHLQQTRGQTGKRQEGGQ